MKNYIKLFQEGGPMGGDPNAQPGGMPPEGQGGAPAGGPDQMQQAIEMMAQALQAQDCEALMQSAGMLLESIMGAAPGGGEEAGGPPQEQGPPAFKKGGSLKKIEAMKGGKMSKEDEKKKGIGAYMKGAKAKMKESKK